MRKVTFLFAALAAVVMIGCTKPDDNNGKKPDIDKPKPQKEFSFTMTFNEQYKKDSVHNYSNIYIDISNYRNDVKERMVVPFDITIKDTDPEKNIVYILKPVDKTDVQRHQVLNKDFEFGTIVSIGTNHFNKLDKIKIKGLKGKAKIRPLEPGTFQLDFQLQKYDTIAKKYIGAPVVTRASAFNVVKIITEVRNDKLEWKVLDGDQQDDKYLSNYSVAEEYKYYLECGKIKSIGSFKEGYRIGMDLKEFGGDENLPDEFNLTISQILKNGDYNIMAYKKVLIKK
ncbi:hypothetical protein HW49_08075 [Porphyromonadaceae bacterium COT-184 OH4590]|nr:hypothetical protein HW49_08075 [Porphyromonadaceae bacterium COT-184 OH4590]